MTRSKFEFVTADTNRKIIWLVDLDGPVSMTNDAEAVCESVNDAMPGYRIVYRDTMMNWDEMVHDGGRFVRFAPARDMGIEI